MNRSIYMVIFVLLFTGIFGAKKISTANGNWDDPSIWSPTGVPAGISDSVIINSNVTFTTSLNYTVNLIWVQPGFSLTTINKALIVDGNIKNEGFMDVRYLTVGNGLSSVNSGTISGYRYADGNVSITNSGNLYSDTIVFSGDFVNNANIQCTQLYTSAPTLNNSYILTSNLLNISATFTNAIGASITSQSDVMVGGSFFVNAGSSVVSMSILVNTSINNNGNVITSGLTNGSGTVTGTGGKYCITNCFINNAVVSGSIDICDATPGSFCDINTGTITGTITNCTAGPCQIPGINLRENNSGQNFRIFPNPSSDWVLVETDNITISEIELLTMEGRALLLKKGKGIQQIDLKGLTSGIYMLRIKSADRIQTLKLVYKAD